MSVSDPFTGTGGFGANWTDTGIGGSAPGVVGGVAYGNLPAGYSFIYWAANSFNAAQSGQIDVAVSQNYVGPVVRGSGSGSSTTGYVYFAHGSLQKCVSGSFTAIASPTAGVPGDTLKLDWDSTTGWTCTKNGSGSGSGTDAAIAGPGAPGVAWFSNGAAADNFVGTGEIAAGDTLFAQGVM